MSNLHLDFETYSEAPFGRKKGSVGLDQYAKHPSTEVLMTAWAFDQGPVEQVESGSEKLLREVAQCQDITLHAFNAPFERVIMREVLGIDIPIERWRCTMVHAYHLAFAGGLAEVGAALGLAQDKRKLDEGNKLVHKFCSPAPRNHKIRRYTRENAPEDWGRFLDYNCQDVVAEREISMLLARYPMPEEEWNLWHIDQRINDRGLPIDKEVVNQSIQVFHAERKHLTEELRKLTGLPNPGSVSQLLSWLKARGYPEDDLQADTVTAVLEMPEWELDSQMRAVLRLRQQLARTAGSKWEAYQRMTDWNGTWGRLHHVFQFGGAQRTQRWAGRGVQPHNLHRSPVDQDLKVEALLSGNRDWVEVMYG